MRIQILSAILLFGTPQVGHAQRIETPVRQSTLTARPQTYQPLTLRDASRNDRWLGLGVRDVRWAPDGSTLYFRWNEHPQANDVPEADPWYKTDPTGSWVERVTEPSEPSSIPGADMEWGPDGRRAVWTSGAAVFLYESGDARPIVALGAPIQSARFLGDGAVDIVSGESLYRYVIDEGSVSLIASRYVVDSGPVTPQGRWLSEEQRELFAHVRGQDARREATAAAARAGTRTQPIPVKAGQHLEGIQASPDGRYLTFRVRDLALDRPAYGLHRLFGRIGLFGGQDGASQNGGAQRQRDPGHCDH